MNKFSDFKIPPRPNEFEGDKIPVTRLIGVPIEVHRFAIEPSKVVEGTECLKLQIRKGGDPRIVFTGSKGLIQQIRQISTEQFPFTTVIQKENDSYQFT